MLLSTQSALLEKRVGIEKGLIILKEAGFDAYDYSLFQMRDVVGSPLNREDYLDCAEKIRRFADGIGIVCNQAHAPFPSSHKDPKKNESFFGDIVRSIEFAGVLGAKCIVIHPKKHLRYRYHHEKLKEINLEFYRSLIPYAEKSHIKIAVENMWEVQKFPKRKIVDSTCSSAEEMNDYIDTLNSPWICGCLDIGHIPLVRRDPAEFIKALGKERLQALHIHDNDLLRDMHRLPYQHSINFAPVLDALNEIGYEGDFTYEDEQTLRHVPIELLPATAKYMAEVGRYMMSQISRSK